MIKEYFESLKFDLEVCKIKYEKCEDVTIVTFTNKLYYRKGIEILYTDKCKTIKLKPLRVVHNTFHLEGKLLKGTFSLASIPVYEGTLMQVNNNLDYSDVFPIIVIVRTYGEEIPSNLDSAFCSIPTYRILVLDDITTQRNLAIFLLEGIQNDTKNFGKPTGVNLREFDTFGNITENGSTQSIFNKELKGCSISMALPMRNRKLCC